MEQRSPLRTFTDEQDGSTLVYCPECYAMASLNNIRDFQHEEGCQVDAE